MTKKGIYNKEYSRDREFEESFLEFPYKKIPNALQNLFCVCDNVKLFHIFLSLLPSGRIWEILASPIFVECVSYKEMAMYLPCLVGISDLTGLT